MMVGRGGEKQWVSGMAPDPTGAQGLFPPWEAHGQVLEAGGFAGGTAGQGCSPPKMPEVQCLLGATSQRQTFKGHNLEVAADG